MSKAVSGIAVPSRITSRQCVIESHAAARQRLFGAAVFVYAASLCVPKTSSGFQRMEFSEGTGRSGATDDHQAEVVEQPLRCCLRPHHRSVLLTNHKEKRNHGTTPRSSPTKSTKSTLSGHSPAIGAAFPVSLRWGTGRSPPRAAPSRVRQRGCPRTRALRRPGSPVGSRNCRRG